MAMRCMNCGKGVMFGHNVSHAKNRTNRKFKPNLHSVRVKIGSNSKRMKLCTKCTRMIKKATGQKKQAESPVTSAAA
ncbi:MAG: 50S ribosomal protein L28 [Patescibacteria group bacterium]|nr:50S ribosomal protein L28 [Patescibacteria group bacterium]MDE2590715.1 50S ribosomal protein L28 [Patescibacteria group bacterium]